MSALIKAESCGAEAELFSSRPMEMKTRKTSKQAPLDIIEGFYSAQIAYHLHRSGLLERLSPVRSVKALAREFEYDETILTALLEFLYQSSDIILRHAANRYSVRRKYRTYYFLGFQLDKFIGAYGPAALRLEELLRSPTRGRTFVDRKAQAGAFFRIESPPNYVVEQLVRKLGIRSILDLGCGQAGLLTGLCQQDTSFRGWGIDENPTICRLARQKVLKAGLNNRIRIVCGDAQDIGTHFDGRIRNSVECLHSKDLLNELFGHGDLHAVRYLKRLKRYFSGKLLFVVDYYGKLTRAPYVARKYRHTLIHDLIQALSSQGIPPPDLKGWMRVYESAGCHLQHAYEGDDQGIEWFVHVLRL